MKKNKASLKDYYAILGVAHNATLQEIRQAFRRHAHKLHPDRNSSSDANMRFHEVREAYQVLKSPISRNKYDAQVIANYCDDLVGNFDERRRKKKAYRSEFSRIMCKAPRARSGILTG